MDFRNDFKLNFFVTSQESGFSLSDFADLAQLVIAAINIYLVIKIFGFEQKQKKLDRKNESKSIKLQGFKEFVISPNFVHLQNYFSNLLMLRQRITMPVLDEDLAIDLSNSVKLEASKFRLNFYDSILNINREMYESIKEKTQELSDTLIHAINDENCDLTSDEIFEENFLLPINYAKNEIVALLVNYTGD